MTTTREFKPGDRVRLVLRDGREYPSEVLSVDEHVATITLDAEPAPALVAVWHAITMPVVVEVGE